METVCRWHGGPPASAHHDRRDTRTQHAPSAVAQPDRPCAEYPSPMSLIFATQLTAIATVILAVGAIVTGVLAYFAFRAQRQELQTLNQSVTDAEEQRRRDADEQRRSQAAKVTAWFTQDSNGNWGARIRNASDLPVIDVKTAFHYISETQPGGEWQPVERGATIKAIRVLPLQSDRFTEIPDDIRKKADDLNDNTYVVSIEFTTPPGTTGNATRAARSFPGPDNGRRGAGHPRAGLPPSSPSHESNQHRGAAVLSIHACRAPVWPSSAPRTATTTSSVTSWSDQYERSFGADDTTGSPRSSVRRLKQAILQSSRTSLSLAAPRVECCFGCPRWSP